MRKTGIHQKTDKKTLLGRTFLGKHQFWGDFGIPGRSLGKALGRILGRKFGGAKKVGKNVVSVVASAGDAYPSKEGFREDSQVGKIQHAFAHPNGWAGGLFALRVTRRGHLEVGSFEALSL